MDERVLLDGGVVYCWKGRRPGATVLTASRGRLVLTDHRLLFLVGERGPAGRSGGAAACFTLDAAAGVDVGALDHPDSREFLLVGLTTYRVVSRAARSWLRVVGHDAGGTPRRHCFSTRGELPSGQGWQVHIAAARRALGVAQPLASRSSA